jgi:hypothetical protein
MKPFFAQVEGDTLAQGDLLAKCPIPEFPADFGTGEGKRNVLVREGDLIVVTQSCDLENRKAPLVALCPVFTSPQLATINQKFQKPSELETIRRGRIEGFHMLASPDNPTDTQGVLVVDFRQIVSLPFAYLTAHAATLGKRWRLESPFLEHFSQAFARFFMRVGLPSSIPEFK